MVIVFIVSVAGLLACLGLAMRIFFDFSDNYHEILFSKGDTVAYAYGMKQFGNIGILLLGSIGPFIGMAYSLSHLINLA